MKLDLTAARRLNSYRELLLARAAEEWDRPFLLFEDQCYSFAHVYRQANRVANFLRQMGIKKGDRVLVMLPNCPEMLYVWFGAAKLGAAMIPINFHLRGDTLAYIMNHAESTVFIGSDEYYVKNVAPIRGELRRIQHYVIAGDQVPEGSQSLTKLMAQSDADEPPAVALDRGDPLAIIYTSGTTGRPKGAVLSHYSYINTACEFLYQARIDHRDTLMTSLPLFHVNAQQTSTTGALVAGVSLALIPWFSASDFWNQTRRYGATVANYIGSMLIALYKQPARESDGDNPLRVMVGAPAPKEIHRQFEQRFQVKVVEGYGLTETGTVCMINPYDGVRVGSCGKDLTYTTVKIFDDEDREVASGVMGEIVVKSHVPHAFMTGYYKEPEKTAAVMRGGCFHTGDRGYQDEDGYNYFVDRMKDCIRRRGENISSFEIERVVNAYPKVLELAAVGVPAEMGEEDVKIYVVMRPGQEATPEEILDWCQERMGYFMVPRYVEFRDALPKTATERVQKLELRAEGAGKAWDREQAGYKLKR